MWTVLAPLALAPLLSSATPQTAQEGKSIRHANLALASPGGPLPFRLRLDDEGRTWLRHSGTWNEVGPLVIEGERFELRLPPYQSRLVGEHVDGLPDSGDWQRDKGAGWATELTFSRRTPIEPEFNGELFSGRWRVQFSKSEDYAVGVFDASSGVTGTFLTTVGDYGVLEGGELALGKLTLSCFDGAHAFLFKAQAQLDGTLKGDFWSRGAWHETWTATRDPDVQLPDGFGLSRWTGAVPLGELAYPDLELETRRLDDPAFAGKARLLVVFGSWCPNCNDLTKVLKRLRERYGDRGLSILGLAFEFADDPEQRALAVLEYMQHHGATWPVLLAGSSDKAEASAAFPLLDEVRAYPTTVFMDGSGDVKAVYTGFSGPATGGLHDELVHRFETFVEELLGAPEEDGNAPGDGR